MNDTQTIPTIPIGSDTAAVTPEPIWEPWHIILIAAILLILVGAVVAVIVLKHRKKRREQSLLPRW